MSMDEQKRLLNMKKAIDALKVRISRESLMSVPEVMARLGMSRETVVRLPVAILPYADFGSGGRKSMRRYHPADVAACDVRMRAWNRAKEEGAGPRYLEQCRLEIEARDAKVLELANQLHVPPAA